jgi:hypothetical protein
LDDIRVDEVGSHGHLSLP